MNMISERKNKLLNDIKQCDSLHNNCDYLLEHSDCDILIEYIESLESIIKELKNQPTAYLTKYMDDLGFVETKTLNQLIAELEEKYTQ